MSKVWGERFAIVPDAVLMAPVSANAKVLWAVLARYADPDGHCYPTLKTLAELLGVSTDTVGRAKRELIDAELLRAEEHFDDQGRRTADDLFLRGAHRKDAVTFAGGPPQGCGDPHRNGAVTNKKGDSEGKEITTTRARERKSGAPARGEPQSQYPELKRPAREQRILDGPFHRVGDLD